MRSGQHAFLRLTAADERARVAGVQNQQLFALNAADQRVQRFAGKRAFCFAIAQQQINLIVVCGG